MAFEEGRDFTIEDDVVIQGNRRRKRAQVQCRVICVFISVVIALLFMVMVGVTTYLLTNTKCTDSDILSKSTMQPDKVSDAVTENTQEGSSVDLSQGSETSEWSSDGGWGKPDVVVRHDDWVGRLPSVVNPLHYKLSITPYIYQEDVPIEKDNLTFDGNVSITIQCNERTNEIILHMAAIIILELAVYEDSTEEANLVDRYETDYYHEFLKIKLVNNLTVDSLYLIHIQYEGILTEEPIGFFYISYKDEFGETRLGGVTLMEPTYARTFTPCFDEPEFKAEFDITIRHRSDMRALSNGIELSITDLGGGMTGWKQTVFKTTPKMSTYLLAIAVTHFVSVTKTTDSGSLIRVWSKPQDINYAIYSLEKAVKETTFFESLLNFTYPLEKQDMIALPIYGPLAMENWGLIVYSENQLIFNPQNDPFDQKKDLALTVSHELAHQWFGNLVTMKWWDDIWLNEGFASYMEFLGVDYCEPNWNIMDFLHEVCSQVFAIDSSAITHPIRQRVNTPDELLYIFDTITYSKGALVLRMLEHILGKEVFITGLRNYLRLHAYANTNTDDLWESFTEADVDHGGNDVKRIMDAWTLQLGYPLLTFNRTTDKIISVSQKMFLCDYEAINKFGDLRYTWEVSISHTHESEENYESPTKDWLHGDEIVEFSLSAGVQPTDWYLVNIGRYGFYRVNYEAANWNRLIAQLLQQHTSIPVQNRFQLLDDAGALFQVDELDVHILLNLTLYLHQEFEYLPWYAASSIAHQLRRLLKGQPSFSLLQNYWHNRFLPIYRKLKRASNNTHGYSEATTSFRRLTTEAACLFEVDDCLQTAKDLYARFIDNPTINPFPLNDGLRTSLYCFAISQGGQREWEFAFRQYVSKSSDKWLDALTCSTKPRILNRLLEEAYDGLYGRYTFSNVVSSLASRDVGLPIVWDFVQQHLDEKRIDYKKDGSVYSALKDIAQYLFTDVHLQQLVALGKKRDLGRDYRLAIEKVKYNIKKRARYSGDVGLWMTQHV